jgi:site-specific recombinase XerD
MPAAAHLKPRTQAARRNAPLPQPMPSLANVSDLPILGKSFVRSLRARNLSPATVRIYSISVANFITFLDTRNMPLQLANITREHCEEWLEELSRESAPATVSTRLRGLKAYMDWAVDDGEISSSPLAKVKRPQEIDAPRPVHATDDIEKLLKVCKVRKTDTGERAFMGLRDTAIITLLYDTGMRRSELAYLTVDNVDLDFNVVDVVGKGNRPRRVPFGHRVARALDLYLRARSKHRLAHPEQTALWLGRSGPLNDSAVDLMLRRRAEEAGLKTHAHLFRHTFAHNWLVQGGQETDLMMLMGWKSRDMVGHYARSAAAERAVEAHRRLSPADRLK